LTLGCDKNLVDSEALLGRFLAHGFQIAPRPEEADVWVLNTCGFLSAARTDSLTSLQELARRKSDAHTLAVVGCWAQEHAAAIAGRFPEVDIVAGVGEFDRIVAACAAGEKARIVAEPHSASYGGFRGRPLLTPRHLAYVKISEGCSCHCTFCRIPLIRGPLRSRPIAEIVSEVRGLAAEGVREIQIVSQNTSDYGRDRGRDDDLPALLRELNKIEDLRRIRLYYLYAGMLPAESVLKLLNLEKVVPYLDVPVQHASPRLLRAMKRPGDPERVEESLRFLRRERPELVLRSTVMLGFPGEEEDDVEQLADFLARVEFDHLGTYRYSPEEGTTAARLPERPPDEEVADREARILDLQAEISLQRQTSRLGRRYEVVVDAVLPRGEVQDLWDALRGGQWLEKAEREGSVAVMSSRDTVALGRSYHYGYDSDGVVVLATPALAPGDWIEARFTAVTAFDAWAVAAQDLSELKGLRAC
jgi:ribosomal protein S12 methylthiotransferase